MVVIYGTKIFAENNILQCSAVPKYLSANGSECLGCGWLAMMNMTRSHHCQWQADHVVLDQSSSMMYRRQMPFHQSLEDNLVKQPPLCHAFYGIHSLQWMWHHRQCQYVSWCCCSAWRSMSMNVVWRWRWWWWWEWEEVKYYGYFPKTVWNSALLKLVWISIPALWPWYSSIVLLLGILYLHLHLDSTRGIIFGWPPDAKHFHFHVAV